MEALHEHGLQGQYIDFLYVDEAQDNLIIDAACALPLSTVCWLKLIFSAPEQYYEHYVPTHMDYSSRGIRRRPFRLEVLSALASSRRSCTAWRCGSIPFTVT